MQAQHDEHEADEGTRTHTGVRHQPTVRVRVGVGVEAESELEPLLLPSRVVLCTDIVVHKGAGDWGQGKEVGEEVWTANGGTPLGLRGIAAVAGGHCVGLPLKCNHSRARASGRGRGSDRAKQS